MLVYIQYARGNPQDWEAVNLTTDKDIRDLPKRPEPQAGDPGTVEVDVGGGFGVQTALDTSHASADDFGWVYDVSIQGQSLSGASGLHFTMDGGALVVTRWATSSVHIADGDQYAQRWRYQLPVVDGRLDPPRLQPRITLEEVWTEHADRTARYQAHQADPVVSPWSAWSMPGPENKRRYSVWQVARGGVANSHTGAVEYEENGIPTVLADDEKLVAVFDTDPSKFLTSFNREIVEVVPRHAKATPDAQDICTTCNRVTAPVDLQEAAKSDARGYPRWMTESA